MRRALLLPIFFALGCGGSSGFRIDNVALSPEDVPVNPGGTETLHFSADIFDDLHVVTSAWVQTENGPLWIDLVRGVDPHWSVTVPLSALNGLPVGTYRFDIHAEDDGGRRVLLQDAVRLKIRLN